MSQTGGGLAKIPAAGGAPVTLCNPPGVIRGPSWGDDGSIVFSTTDRETGLFRVSSGGGTPVVLTKPDASKGEADHLFPSALPSGRGVLFIIHQVGAGDTELAVLDSKDGTIKRLVSGVAAARYLDGQLVYVVNGTLYTRSFDIERLEIAGEPIPLAEGVLAPSGGGAYFDVARNGTIVYVPTSTGPPRRLMWVDRSGNETPVGAPDLPYNYVRLSPKGDRIAVELNDEGADIHTWDVARRTLARVTSDPREDAAPVWTADGVDLIYSSRRGAGSILFRQVADGSAAPRTLAAFRGTRMPTGVTRDGQTLVGHETELGPWHLFIAPLDRVESDNQRSNIEGNKWVTSPNGRFIAYDAQQSGSTQVFVRPFPDATAARWQISATGGINPIWRADGRELFYRAPQDPRTDGAPGGPLLVVAVDTSGSAFEWQTSHELFSTLPYHTRSVHPFDVSQDGQRLLMIKNLDVARDAGGRMVVMLNALKR